MAPLDDTQARTANDGPPPRTVAKTAKKARRGLARLAAPYWFGDQKKAAWLLTAALAAVSIAQVFLQIRLNIWSNDFFNAVDARDGHGVLAQILIVAGLAVGLMAAAAYQIDLKMAVQGGWRRALTHRLIDRWLGRGTHYQLHFLGKTYDNPDQRIAEDTFMVTQAAVDFAVGILSSVLLLGGFFAVLWTLSGTLSLAFIGIEGGIPGYLVLAALLYAIIGTGFVHLLGKPLLQINEKRRKREGDFRAALQRIRENSEGIAFLRGEDTERAGLHHAFDRILSIWRKLRRGTRRVTWATSAYAIVAPIFPLLVAAPQYLAGEMTLGGLMQASLAFVQVQTALGWFVDNYARLADWRSAANRILALDAAGKVMAEESDDEQETRIKLRSGTDEVLRLIDLQVATQDGTVVIGSATIEVRPGENVLIVGESGVGKSSLIRAIAGLWTWGSGTIEWPAGASTMFVPQRDYVPVGSLRAMLTYPAHPATIADDVLAAALKRCELEYLVPRLDDVERWKDTLSNSERERLGFARVLIHRPQWVFLDEAMGHLDDRELASMMRIFREELAHATVVTIEHRAGLDQYHDRTLTLVRADEGARLKARSIAAAEPTPQVADLSSLLSAALARLRRKQF